MIPKKGKNEENVGLRRSGRLARKFTRTSKRLAEKKTETKDLKKRKSKVEDKLQKKGKPKITKRKAKSKVIEPKPKRISKKQGNERTTPTTDSSAINEKNESFRKYGIVVPSVDEIKDKIREARANIAKMKSLYDNMKEQHADLDDPIEPFVEYTPPDVDNDELVDLLDCKHLKPEELNKLFHENLQYLEDISNGVIYSNRHEKFFKYPNISCFSYAPEMCMFTHNQIEQLATALEENVALGNKDSSYIFKVLIPETCLKIFMDVHDKTKSEAKEYIEWRPIL